MLLPILNGILSLRLAPVTWSLFLINLVVFSVTFQKSDSTQKFLEKSLSDSYFAQTQGYLFASYVEKNVQRYPANIAHMASRTLNSNDVSMTRVMGSLAFRDTSFMHEALDFNMSGDTVAIEYWRNKFSEIIERQGDHPSYKIGLTLDDLSWQKLVTYQFAHGGFSHFIGNMIFFLFFAAVLERVLGGLAVLSIYLLSGFMGAMVYILASEASAIPLIGASGAVSGIMCLFVMLFWRHNVRYLFFLFVPRRGFFGFIFLPAWVILFIWGIHDVAGYLATPAVYGGVAYSAHLGGQLCGLLFGTLFIIIRRLQGLPVLPPQLPVDTAPVFTKYV